MGRDKMTSCFIIAEAGVNHNGDIEIARRMITEAKEAGADAIKFQTFWNISKLKKYELTKVEFHHLYKFCKDKDITFLSTPHTFEAIHFLDALVPIYKIASTYMGNANFLFEVAEKGKPIMLSTGSLLHESGMATDEEITRALGWLKKAPTVTLLHCVSKYPCKSPHYERIKELKSLCSNVGLSDHSKNIEVPIVPFIERHLKLDDADCLDNSVSLTPKEFKKFVDYVKRKS